MQNFLTHLKTGLIAAHRDEQGAEGLEKLLIIAAIVLPLLGLLIVFRDRISDWVTGIWESVVGDNGGYQPPDVDTPNSN